MSEAINYINNILDTMSKTLDTISKTIDSSRITIDESLDRFGNDIKEIYKQAEAFCDKHKNDSDIETPEEQFLYSVMQHRKDLNISENYASRLERAKDYLKINAAFGKCLILYHTDDSSKSEWYTTLKTYNKEMESALKDAVRVLEKLGKKKEEPRGDTVKDEILLATATKLYSSCKKKLSGLTKKGLFGRNLVQSFFDKYFTEDGKCFSYKIRSRFDKNKRTVKELDKIKEKIKKECLLLLDENEARNILNKKFDKLTDYFKLDKNKLKGLKKFQEAGAIRANRGVYHALSNPDFKSIYTKMKDADKNNLRNMLENLMVDKKNFFYINGKRPRTAQDVMEKLITQFRNLGKTNKSLYSIANCAIRALQKYASNKKA